MCLVSCGKVAVSRPWKVLVERCFSQEHYLNFNISVNEHTSKVFPFLQKPCHRKRLNVAVAICAVGH